MSSFTVRSAAGVLVSLLNPVDISPIDSVDQDHPSSSEESSESGAPKKIHVCGECGRPFSTTGHLNRHLTMHTGYRDHVCPFPGCGKSASRADNLVQHYRMHLPRGEHNICTSYIRSRMEQKMEEVGVSPVRKPRGRKDAQLSPRHVFGYSLPSPRLTAERLTPPSRRNSMSSESRTSWSPTPTTHERPMTGRSDSAMSCSPSPPLLTPPLACKTAYTEQDQYFAVRYGCYHVGPSVYQPSACVTDYSRSLPVSNAREE